MPVPPLTEPKAGESTWKLWEHVYALVRVVKPWQKVTVTIADGKGAVVPGASGKVTVSDANVTLELKGIASGTPGVITGAVNGVPSKATISFVKDWAAI